MTLNGTTYGSVYLGYDSCDNGVFVKIVQPGGVYPSQFSQGLMVINGSESGIYCTMYSGTECQSYEAGAGSTNYGKGHFVIGVGSGAQDAWGVTPNFTP